MLKQFKFILFLTCAFTSALLHAAKIEHLRVIWSESPHKQASFLWTSELNNRQFLYYRKEGTAHFDKVHANFHKLSWQSSDRIYSTRLENLEADTMYEIKAGGLSEQTTIYRFKTAPQVNSTSWKLLFGGDSRSDRRKRVEMNKLISKLRAKNPDILALVHGGDFVMTGHLWILWKRWFEDYEYTISNGNQLLPIIPTRGNHEQSAFLFNKVFDYPGESKNYYLTKIGSLGLITLNTNIASGGEQKLWLDKTLDKLAETTPWLVTNYHEPAWPAVKAPGAARVHWVPVFENHFVDLAFESDGHVLKRTVPIRKDKIDEELGTTYVGEGGLGVKQRIPRKVNEWYFASPGYATAAHHIMILSGQEDKMQLEVLDAQGKSFDQIEFSSRHKQRKSFREKSLLLVGGQRAVSR